MTTTRDMKKAVPLTPYSKCCHIKLISPLLHFPLLLWPFMKLSTTHTWNKMFPTWQNVPNLAKRSQASLPGFSSLEHIL